MTETVIGIFKSQEHVSMIIDELKELGYDPKSMSILMKHVQEEGHEHGDTRSSHVAGSTVSGATTGGLLGGLAGLLVGLGVFTIPGVGPLLVGGPIAGALGITGAVATTVTGAAEGIVAGGLIGGLMGLGMHEEEARKYEEEIMSGGILLAVSAPDEKAEEVQNLLTKHGATEVKMLNLPVEDEYVAKHRTEHHAEYHGGA
ncbi:MAG: DUF3341 domain-containing protein [Candidatus Daviesbacteria bacterium]|nr:DUF3341 domain-containing protein [Candidatus Daviesbacteria bacterium]